MTQAPQPLHSCSSMCTIGRLAINRSPSCGLCSSVAARCLLAALAVVSPGHACRWLCRALCTRPRMRFRRCSEPGARCVGYRPSCPQPVSAIAPYLTIALEQSLVNLRQHPFSTTVEHLFARSVHVGWRSVCDKSRTGVIPPRPGNDSLDSGPGVCCGGGPVD
jgi:hypothetical protein